MKEEALKLAEIFEEVGRAKYPYHLDAAEMLRKLVEELDKLEKDLALKTRDRDVFCDFTIAYEKRIKELDKQGEPVAIVRKYTMSGIDSFSVELLESLKEGTELYTTPQTKPLSDEEILAISNMMPYADRFDFARAIEERHGIK